MPKHKQLPAASVALIKSLRSVRCLSRKVANEQLCKTIAGFAVGSAIGGGAGLLAKMVKPRPVILFNSQKLFDDYRSKVSADRKLSASDKQKKLQAIDDVKKNFKGIEERYGDLLNKLDSNIPEISMEIARLESQGIGKEVIRGKIQSATKNPNVCALP